MRKFAFFLTIVFLFNFANAQEWRPFRLNEKYNYSLGNSKFHETIWIDSLTVEDSDTVLFFNRIIKRVAIAPYGVNGDGYYYLHEQSQHFLKKSKCFSNGDITFEEDNTHKYLIRTKANLFDSWIFDSISNDTAKIVQISNQLLFGYIDSMKTIKLTSGDTIIISKMFGLIKFPVFDSLNQHINLVGIEGRNVGEIVPNFFDFFDFKIGDIFYYKEERKNRWYLDVTLKKIVIRDKQINGDTISFETIYLSRCIREGTYDYERDTIYTMQNDRIIKFINSNNHFLNKYNNQIFNSTANHVDYKPIKVGLDTTFNIMSKAVPFYSYCHDGHGDTIVTSMGCAPTCDSVKYGEHFGLLSRFWLEHHFMNMYHSWIKEDLLGCVKDGIAYGTILNISTFLSIPHENGGLATIRIYPNPASDILYIDSEEVEKKLTISILNPHGQIILEQPIKDKITTINLADFEKGVYFAIISGEKVNEARKILIE